MSASRFDGGRMGFELPVRNRTRPNEIYERLYRMREVVARDDKVLIPAQVGSCPITVVLDSGAMTNVLPYHTFRDWVKKKVPFRQDPHPHPRLICDASGNEIPHKANPIYVTIRLGANNHFENCKFLILANITSIILGLEFMRDEFLNLHFIKVPGMDKRQPLIKIGENRPQTETREILCAYNSEATATPNGYGQLIPGLNILRMSVTEPHLAILAVSVRDQDSPLIIKENLVQVHNGLIQVRLLNRANGNIAYSPATNFVDYEVINSARIMTTAETYVTNAAGIPVSKHLPPPEDEFGPDCPPIEDADEDTILPQGIDFEEHEDNEYSWEDAFAKRDFPEHLRSKFVSEARRRCGNVFAKHSMDAGTLDPKIMCIEDLQLKDDLPVRTPPIKLDHIRRRQVQDMLDKLEAAKIIQKSASKHYSPVFVVPKANGALRMVTSYCKLNSKMKPQFYQIPDTKNILRQIAQANNGKVKYFTQIDLSNAYSSIIVNGEAREQMGLISMDHTYIALRLMFGSQIAPAKFNEALKRVLDRCQDAHDPYCFSFFDDITIVSGDDLDDHMEKVLRVLETLQKAGFKVQMEKCDFYQKEVQVLGARINSLGIFPLEKHIKAIRQLKPATTVNEVQKIQGLLVWHAHLLPLFSHHMNPLNQLTRKDVPFHWGPAQQEALDYFKRVVESHIMTHFPDYDQEVYLCTDASKVAIGAVAYQIKSYKRTPEVLADKLLLKDHKEITREFPVLPQPGNRCPKAYKLLEGVEMDLAQRMVDTASLELNSDQSELVHVCQPIGYFSKSLDRTQQNYIALEQEAMCLVMAVTHFKDLLLGFKERYIITDSQPLLYMMRRAVTEDAKISRWLLKLKQVPMEITVVHCKGELNVIADLMSRSLFIGMRPREEDPNKPDKLSKKYPVMVRSPFKPGQMITLDQVKQVILDNPGVVYNIIPEDNPSDISSRPGTATPLEVETLGYLGSSIAGTLHAKLERANIIRHQREDAMCKTRMENLEKLKHFYFHQGLLYRKTTADQTDYEAGRICMPDSLLPTLIAYYHISNHAGAQAIYHQIKEGYYAFQLLKKVTLFCQACYLCMICKAHQTKQPFASGPFFPMERMSTWAIDIVSSFTPFKGYKAILTCVETYTNFIIAVPLKYETAAEISTEIMRIFTTFPTPRTIISDNARNLLRSKTLQSICYYFGVSIHCVTPYSSQSNAMAENANRKISDLLRIVCEQTSRKWVEILPLVQIALNSKPVKGIGYNTPYEAVFGTKGNRKFKFTEKEKEQTGHPELVGMWNEEHARIHTAVKNYAEPRNKATKNASVKVPAKTYEKGEYVFVKNLTPQAYKKLRTKVFRVPMIVISDLGQALLVKDYQQRIRKHHKDHVVRCNAMDQVLYDSLPHELKMNIELFFTSKHLEDFFKDPHAVPHIFFKLDKCRLTAPPTFDSLYEQPLTNEESDTLTAVNAQSQKDQNDDTSPTQTLTPIPEDEDSDLDDEVEELDPDITRVGIQPDADLPEMDPTTQFRLSVEEAERDSNDKENPDVDQESLRVASAFHKEAQQNYAQLDDPMNGTIKRGSQRTPSDSSWSTAGTAPYDHDRNVTFMEDSGDSITPQGTDTETGSLNSILSAIQNDNDEPPREINTPSDPNSTPNPYNLRSRRK